MKLTKLEVYLLNAMRTNEYNDALQDGHTWTFTAIDNSGMEPEAARGVIASLVKKGLVVAEKGNKKSGDEDTIGFTAAGAALFDKADGEENKEWGGPKLLKEVEDARTTKALADTKKAVELIAVPAKPTKAKVKEVTVLAFTNMKIGTFPVKSQTAKTITVLTAKGAEMVFDKETGKQTNAKNPNFANKLQK